MPRSTKIVVTLGPACSDPAVLERMLAAGVDVVRLNFSHGAAADHVERARLVRATAARLGVEVAIMADLQGPKIRVGKFDGGSTVLQVGQTFVLDAAMTALGTNERVGLDYKDLPRDVKPGDEVDVQLPHGKETFRVTGSEVVRWDASGIQTHDGGKPRIALVTCWPLDAKVSGPMRYVVWAERVDHEPLKAA